jgi:hypothetical protein
VRNKLFLSLVAAAVLMPLCAVTSNASWFSHNSSVKSTQVNILQNTKLANGKTLEAGNYRIDIPLNSKSPELKFYRDGKLMASVPAIVKQETRRPSETEVDFSRKGGAEYLTEVRPRGLTQGYVISSSSAMKSGV